MESKKTPCEKCNVEDFCAANNWKLWDQNNKKCPNYKQGLKQFKQFLKEEGYIK